MDSPAARAHDLALTAMLDPGDVDVGETLEVLAAAEGDTEATRDVLRALTQVALERPEACVDAVPAVATHLETEALRTEALQVLAAVAAAYPHEVAPAAAGAVESLDGAEPERWQAALALVTAVARVAPETVIEAAPTLVSFLERDPRWRRTAAGALPRLAEADPGALRPLVPEMLDALATPGADDETAASVLAAVGTVAKEYPAVARPARDDLVALLDHDSYRVRNNAAGVLADLAERHPADVRPVAERAIELLADDDERVRYNATTILARLADDYPADARPAVDALVGLLDDAQAYTRENACWALGRLAADEAREALARLADGDPEDRVREVAAWALDQL